MAAGGGGGYCGMAGGQDLPLPYHLLSQTSHRPCLSSQNDITGGYIVHVSLKSILNHNHADSICEEKMQGD